ncbi:MAG: hypothetical protein Q4E55_01100 [Bacteroidales bacterium]|nr:hypothetical protein [Bacteroidales bacterium]
MKKFVLFTMCVVALASCGNSAKERELRDRNDSLVAQLASRDAEIDAMMSAFNDVQEGFRQINEAESRVDINNNAEGASATALIKEDIRFITKQLQDNREEIAKLKEQLNNGRIQSAQLKRAVENLTAELDRKQKQIESLQSELAAKNIRIAELDAAVKDLHENLAELHADVAEKTATVAQQEVELNTAWYAIGTKAELKQQNILETGFLQSKKVLKDATFNKDYFTRIDIRSTTSIALGRSPKLLTIHPENSYKIVVNDKKEATLEITDLKAFWAASKYLVVQVK